MAPWHATLACQSTGHARTRCAGTALVGRAPVAQLTWKSNTKRCSEKHSMGGRLRSSSWRVASTCGKMGQSRGGVTRQPLCSASWGSTEVLGQPAKVHRQASPPTKTLGERASALDVRPPTHQQQTHTHTPRKHTRKRKRIHTPTRSTPPCARTSRTGTGCRPPAFRGTACWTATLKGAEGGRIKVEQVSEEGDCSGTKARRAMCPSTGACRAASRGQQGLPGHAEQLGQQREARAGGREGGSPISDL